MSDQLKVLLQIGYYKSYEICVPLSENLLYEAFEPLDIPDTNALGWDQMLCTSGHKISVVMQERERVAKILSETVTKALMDIMSSDDTLMGYRKGEKK